MTSTDQLPRPGAQDRTDRAGTALNAVDVRRHFGTVRAVDGVDLSIDRGEIVALLGPNGAGKTTFLDLVLGFTGPSAGRLDVLGENPGRAVRAGRVGAVLQTGGLLDDLTVRETVAMVAACHPRHIPVDEALARAGADGIAKRKVRKCSGGEQQRLRFALALLTEPDLLLLDEPTAGMDVRARAEFWATMHTEAERGRTVVFATHYLQEAADFADRIVLMRAGRVVLDGSVEEVTATRSRTLNCRWVGDADPQEVADGLGLTDAVTRSGDRVRFLAEDTDTLAWTLLDGRHARDVEISTASLDDVFLDLTSDDTSAAGDPAGTAASDAAPSATRSARKGR